MKRLSWAIVAAIGLASPAFAHATSAYVTTDIDMFSGPDQDYPQIDRLEEGSEVDVQGCTDGWEWCDVVAYGERGWIPGGALQVEYEDRWVPMPEYAPYYRVPIVVFSINDYWDTWYRHRPFYYQRWNWYRWRPPHRQRPFPVDFPPPHGFHHGPPVHHPIVVPMPHPIPGPPVHGRPVPYPVDPPGHGRPVPHPVDPPGHGRPMPYPVDPPGHGRPVQYPVDPPGHQRPAPYPVDPSRNVPRPMPVQPVAPQPKAQPKPSLKDKDPDGQGQRK